MPIPTRSQRAGTPKCSASRGRWAPYLYWKHDNEIREDQSSQPWKAWSVVGICEVLEFSSLGLGQQAYSFCPCPSRIAEESVEALQITRKSGHCLNLYLP